MAQAKPTASRGRRSRARAVGPPDPATRAGPIPLCSVPFCPICTAVTAVGEIRPEFVDHLLAAGREFLLALRAVIDARLEATEGPVKLERLTIE